jgi:hypothetical protein
VKLMIISSLALLQLLVADQVSDTLPLITSCSEA